MIVSADFSWIINTHRALCYLKLAVESIRENAHYKNRPIIVFCENDSDTHDWLKQQSDIETIYEENTVPRGIGGGINVAVSRAKTEFVALLHSDMVISKFYDKPLYDLVSATEYPLLACAWRLEPNIFNGTTRLGTIMAPANTTEGFGVYHHDFRKEEFLEWANPAVLNLPDFRKVEGVSYMMRKKYFIENDSRFAPSSFEDHMQSIIMQLEGYDFVVTGKALVWHFGARSSHFLGQHDKLTGTSERQKTSEAKNIRTWVELWGEYPTFDEYSFIKITPQMRERYNQNKSYYYNS